MESVKSKRKIKLEKLKKIRSSKTHSNSFVLSNISILKKSNSELAKKLSASQSDLLSFQEQYHITWQQNVCLTLELKECERKLKDVEAKLFKKVELTKKIKQSFDDISELLADECSEIFWGDIRKCQVSTKRAERIPVVQHLSNPVSENTNNSKTNDHLLSEKTLNKPVLHEPRSAKRFQCVRVKPSKSIQEPSLKAVEEAEPVQSVHSSTNLEAVFPTNEDNLTKTLQQTYEDPNENLKELPHKKERNVKEDYNVLNSTIQALKLLPKQKKKKKFLTHRYCSTNADDNNISSINIEQPDLEDKENTNVMNENIIKHSTQNKKRSVTFKKLNSPSPLRLYLDPNDTITVSPQIHTDTDDDLHIHQNVPQKRTQCNNSLGEELQTSSSKRRCRGTPISYKEPSLNAKLRRTK